MHDIIFEIKLVSKILQSKTADISLASNQLKRCTEFIEKFRDCWLNYLKSKAKEIANDQGISPVFQEKRSRANKKLFPCESSDEYKPTPEELFKRCVFNLINDTILKSLKDRMDKFSDHCRNGGFYTTWNTYQKKRCLVNVVLVHNIT